MKKVVNFMGTKYDSMAAAGRAMGRSPQTLAGRLGRGLEPSVALVVPDSTPVGLGWKGVDGKVRYTCPWDKSELTVTAREIVEYYRPDLLPAYDQFNPTGQDERPKSK